jgi:hypothetical protein
VTGGARSAGDALPGTQLNIARDRATQNIVHDGVLNVYQGGPPGYRVDEFPLTAPSVPVGVRRQPSRLLAARYQVVDFTGRDTELAQLADWRDDPGLGLAVRLVHGPGGQGKTRLATVLAQRCAERGWVVARAVHRSYDTAPGAGVEAGRVAAGPGLLVIVDYAERWPVEDLLALAQDRLLRSGVPIRVLLLARPAGLWWDNLSYRLGERWDIPAEAMVLTALADTAVERAAVFVAARDRFAGLLDVPDPHRITPPLEGLGADVFGLVLTVHMAALVTVDAHARGQLPPLDPAALSVYLLQRERDHWASMYGHAAGAHPPGGDGPSGVHRHSDPASALPRRRGRPPADRHSCP